MLSGRLFGVSSWSLLLPEALLGVATVALLFVIVKRWAGPVAGLVAALVMALTPVAVLMFRFNNPDALLTFLLALAVYAVLRAQENGSTWIGLLPPGDTSGHTLPFAPDQLMLGKLLGKAGA